LRTSPSLLLLLCHSCATTAAALGARHGVPHLACLGLSLRERRALDGLVAVRLF
ncbi:unnamed protein product, partial [Ectocarpus sp. 8 AP-2014]